MSAVNSSSVVQFDKSDYLIITQIQMDLGFLAVILSGCPVADPALLTGLRQLMGVVWRYLMLHRL